MILAVAASSLAACTKDPNEGILAAEAADCNGPQFMAGRLLSPLKQLLAGVRRAECPAPLTVSVC
jgi:hypothetical protein